MCEGIRTGGVRDLKWSYIPCGKKQNHLLIGLSECWVLTDIIKKTHGGSFGTAR